MEGKPRTVLLNDFPSATDVFGSHEPVASAIGDMVTREEGGKAIALEGSWGSGKSTIVRVLSERLKGQVFVFDAWAHEGDPLRRVFLEKLIEFCWDKIDGRRWSETRDELRRRRKVEKTRVLPQLSFAGGLVTLSILAIPIGAALIAVGGTSSTTLPLNGSTLFYVGLAAVVAAPALLILHLLFWGLRWVRYLLRGGQKPTHALGGISLFVNQTVQESTTETIETPEPSSVEFSSIFASLLSEYLSQPADRLVLVVDNLDRVSRGQALSIWSTLRIFLEECGRKQDGWHGRVWLLVPYDRPAMETLWAEPSRASDRIEAGDPNLGDRDLQPDVLSGSFLAKTFQVRFEVPPLVLADWKVHLLELQKRAFPDHEVDEEFNSAYRIFRRWCDQRRMAPTPRELVLFVNDVGAIHRRWSGRFPLAHLAYYVILRYRDSKVDLVSGLKDGSVPEESYSDLLREGIADHLAAIYFSREPDEARHLLMADDIRRALAIGDAEGLSKLEGHRGFWDLVEELLPEIGRNWDESPDATANAGVALCETGFAEMRQPVRRKALLDFAEAVTAKCDWGILTEGKARGISSYIQFFGDEAHARQLFRQALSATAKPEGEEGVNLEQAQAASVALSTVLKALDLGGFGELYESDGIGLTGPPEWIVSLGSGFWSDRERGRRYWKSLKVPDEDERRALIEDLSPQADTEAWDQRKVQTVAVLSSDAGIDWSPVVAGCVAVLNDVATKFPATKIHDVLVSLWDLGIWNHIKKAGDGGQLAHHLNREVFRESWSAAAECAIAMLALSNVASRPSVGESAQGYGHLDTILAGTAASPLLAEVKSLFALPQGHRALRAMLQSGASFGPLFVMAVRDSIESGSLGAILSPPLVSDCWEQIVRLLLESSDESSLTADAVLVAANAGDVLISHLEESNFDVGRVAAYRAVLKAIPDAPRLLAWLKESLRALGADSWQEALTGSSSTLIVLAAEVKAIDSTLVLEDPLQDALEQYGRSLLIMDGSAPAIEPEEELSSAIGCLPDADKTTLARKLLSAAIAEATTSDPFYRVFGDLMAREDVLQSEPSLVHALLTPLVNAECQGGIRWIANFTNAFPTLLDSGRYPKDSVGDFRGRIAEKVASGEADEATAGDLQKLAAALGISVDVPDEDDAD